MGSEMCIRDRSRSGSLVEEQSLLSANKDTLHPNYRIPFQIGKSSMEKDLLELEANKGQRHDYMGTMSNLVPGMSDMSEQVESIMNSMELPTIAHSRHSSLSSAGNIPHNCYPSLKLCLYMMVENNK